MTDQTGTLEKIMRILQRMQWAGPKRGQHIEDLFVASSLLAQREPPPRPTNNPHPPTNIDKKVEKPRPQPANLPGSENQLWGS